MQWVLKCLSHVRSAYDSTYRQKLTRSFFVGRSNRVSHMWELSRIELESQLRLTLNAVESPYHWHTRIPLFLSAHCRQKQSQKSNTLVIDSMTSSRRDSLPALAWRRPLPRACQSTRQARIADRRAVSRSDRSHNIQQVTFLSVNRFLMYSNICREDSKRISRGVARTPPF